MVYNLLYYQKFKINFFLSYMCVYIYTYVCVYDVCIFFEFIFYDCTWYWLKIHLFYYVVYFFYYLANFCYYLWISMHFLVLFMSSIALFGTIYGSHCTILASFTLSTILSAKKFQFQLNKLFPNRSYINTIVQSCQGKIQHPPLDQGFVEYYEVSWFCKTRGYRSLGLSYFLPYKPNIFLYISNIGFIVT